MDIPIIELGALVAERVYCGRVIYTDIREWFRTVVDQLDQVLGEHHEARRDRWHDHQIRHRELGMHMISGQASHSMEELKEIIDHIDQKYKEDEHVHSTEIIGWHQQRTEMHRNVEWYARRWRLFGFMFGSPTMFVVHRMLRRPYPPKWTHPDFKKYHSRKEIIDYEGRHNRIYFDGLSRKWSVCIWGAAWVITEIAFVVLIDVVF